MADEMEGVFTCNAYSTFYNLTKTVGVYMNIQRPRQPRLIGPSGEVIVVGGKTEGF